MGILIRHSEGSGGMVSGGGFDTAFANSLCPPVNSSSSSSSNIDVIFLALLCCSLRVVSDILRQTLTVFCCDRDLYFISTNVELLIAVGDVDELSVCTKLGNY